MRAVLVALAVIAIAARGQASGADSCERTVPQGWSSMRRASIALKVQRAGLDPAPLLASLDARVAATTDLREEGCRATAASERAAWTRRLVCVDEAWAKTSAALDLLGHRDDAVVRDGADSLGEVPPLDSCARGSLPAVPENLDPVRRARYVALADRIHATETNRTLAPRERLAKLRALEPEVAALRYSPIEARWHWTLGRALNELTDMHGAAEEFDLAAQAGLAAGDDDLYVRALILELHVTSLTASSERIAQLETQAQAGARRLGNPQVDAALAQARATLSWEHGQTAKARELFEEVDALYSKISVAPMYMHVAAVMNLGGICLELGDLDAAERALDRASELALRRYTVAGAPYWEARAARATVYLVPRPSRLRWRGESVARRGRRPRSHAAR